MSQRLVDLFIRQYQFTQYTPRESSSCASLLYASPVSPILIISMALDGAHGYREPLGLRRIPISVGSRTRTINAHVLRCYLPRVWFCTVQTSNPLDIEQASRRSALVTLKQVPIQAMIRTWVAVLKTLARTEDPEKVNMTLIILLEQTLRQEQHHPSRRYLSLFMYTLHLFECLAGISSESKSRYLAITLHEFFVKHGERIATEDTREAMFRWGAAIVSANMNQQERLGCLRQIVNTRPEWRSHGNYAVHHHHSSAVDAFVFAMDRLSRYMEADKDYMVERGRGRTTRFDGRRHGHPGPVRTPLRSYDDASNVAGPLPPDLRWTPHRRTVRGASNDAFGRPILSRDWFNRHGRFDLYDEEIHDSDYWSDPYDLDDFYSDDDSSFR